VLVKKHQKTNIRNIYKTKITTTKMGDTYQSKHGRKAKPGCHCLPWDTMEFEKE